MSQLQQAQNGSPKKTWLINGTCGGCKSYEVADNQINLADIACKNKNSAHFGVKLGVLSPVDMNGCTSYEPKEKAPEGFTLV